MPNEYNDRMRKTRRTFFCPSGHPMDYPPGESEATKLKRQLEQTRNNLEAAQGQAAIAKLERDEIARAHTRMRDRVRNGVCPCCTRSFQNLAQHMKTEHPEFGEKETFKSLREAMGLTQTAIAEEAGLGRSLSSYVSMYENGKPVPEWAERQLDYWVQEQTK